MMHELKARTCYKLCFEPTEEGFRDLCRAKIALGDRFTVRSLDSRLSGFVVGLFEEDCYRLPPDLVKRVVPMHDEGIIRDVAPLVWRFLEDSYISEFLEDGKLRLSTFIRCKGAVSSRTDDREGYVEWYDTGRRRIATSCVGSNAFMLCSSLSPFATNPKKCKHALFILNLNGLIEELTKCIRGKGYDVSAVVKGPCSYSSRQFMVDDVYPRTDEALQKLNDAPGDRLYMMKDARMKYMNEWEYRVLWLTDRSDVPEHLDVIVEHPCDYAQCISVPDKSIMYAR